MSLIFLDLDETLLDRKTTFKIVNRQDNERVYLELDESVNPMLTGIWRKYDLPVKSMGNQYWLSEFLWNKIKAKNKNLTLEDLTILTVDEAFNVKEEKDFTDMLKHLQHVDGEIRIFANMHLDNKEEYLTKVQDLIFKITRKEVKKVHYIDDVREDNAVATTMKLRIILEAMLGHKIKMNRFQDTPLVSHNIVRYYNSEISNIKQIATIQDVFETLISKTDKQLQLKIKTQLEKVKTELQLCFITPNTLKPFQTRRIQIVFPSFIRKFESYKDTF